MYRLAPVVLLVAASASLAAERKDFYGDPLPPGAIARMGTIRLRVDGRVVAFSPDEKMFAVVSFWEGIGLWSTETGLPLREMERSPGRDVAVAFTEDGKSLVAICREGIHEWRTSDGKLLQTVSPKDGPLVHSPSVYESSHVLSRDGKRWAGCTEQEILVGDTKTGATLARLPKADTDPNLLGLSPDGSLLVNRHNKGWICWDVGKRKEMGQFEFWERNFAYPTFAFAPDARTLALFTGLTEDGSVRLWQPGAKQDPINLFPDGKNGPVQFTADGQFLLVPFIEEVKVWDLKRARFVRSIPAPAALRLVQSPRGTYMASTPIGVRGSSEALTVIWNVATGKELHARRPGDDAGFYSAAFSPDGDTLATLGGNEDLRFWNAATGQPLLERDIKPRDAHRIIFSHDGKVLLGVKDNLDHGETIAQNASNGKVTAEFTDGRLLDLSANGQVLLARSKKRDLARERDLLHWSMGKLELRHLTTGRLLPGPAREIVCEMGGFLREGQWLFAARTLTRGETVRGTTAEVYETKTGKRISNWEVSPAIISLRTMPDGRTLAGIVKDGLQFIDGETAKPLHLLNGIHDLTRTAISPDGAWLAVDRCKSIQLWEIATCRELCTFQGHRGDVSSLAFSPDGRRLASAGNETLIWDVHGIETGEKIAVLDQGGLSRCWDDLQHYDAALAYRSMRSLIGNATESVKFLTSRLEPTSRVEAEQLRRWIGDLGSRSFRVRQEAMRLLLRAEEPAEVELRTALDAQPELESANRLRLLLEALNPVRASGEKLRSLRSIQVLERIGTADALALLKKLAEGVPEARQTRTARAAVARLERVGVR